MEETPELKVAVEVSRKWDGTEIAEEISEKLRKKLDSPKFLFLFTTIHYEKEFKKILNGIKDNFPDSPLIGGTLAGFMTNEGSYTRGVITFAIEYPNMEVAIGMGHNTKRNPIRAVEDCSKMIKSKNNQKYSNNILFPFSSAGVVPRVSGLGQRRTILSPKIAATVIKTMSVLKTFQFGPGREDEIIQALINNFGDYWIVGGSTCDDNRWEKNFQFFEREIYSHSIVACSINTDLKCNVESEYGLHPTNIKMKITETTLYGCIVKTIEGEPASKKFLEKVNWPKEFLDENLYRRTLYYPICFEFKGKYHPRVIGTILGNYLGFVNKALADEGEIHIASGRSLMNSVNDVINKFDKNKIKLGFNISCTARLETLGNSIFKINDILNQFYEDKPFILLYLSGEDIRKPREDAIRQNESFNMLNFF
jgi:hypothetical protein